MCFKKKIFFSNLNPFFENTIFNCPFFFLHLFTQFYPQYTPPVFCQVFLIVFIKISFCTIWIVCFVFLFCMFKYFYVKKPVDKIRCCISIYFHGKDTNIFLQQKSKNKTCSCFCNFKHHQNNFVRLLF